MSAFVGKHILIIVENLPVPFDRRVWQEANALKEQGADVSIICPKMKGYTNSFEVLDGINIYRHPLPIEASGAFGYLIEYSTALFYECWLSWKIFFKKKFQVIHGCNPPDLIFLVAIPFKLFGVKYVFDHHDINPELYMAKFNRSDWFYKLMLLFEKLTFKTSNYAIATNESYKEIAVRRGKIKPENVAIVRSGPDTKKVFLQKANPDLKKGKQFLVGYIGVIGEQEGLDLLIQSIKIIRQKRDDIFYAIVGGGTYLEFIKQYAKDNGVDDIIDFYGRVDDKTMLEVLSTADICVNPDVPSEMNNLSTMNKIMEYMALKKPIVQYDLKEGRYSAQEASLYAKNTEVADFADKMTSLLDDPASCRRMGEYGYNRLQNQLSWEKQKLILIDFYKKILNV
jgi:glycosyltransferase involved in cell wall biosynthesis